MPPIASESQTVSNALPRGAFVAAAVTFAAGAEQGVAYGAFSRMLDGLGVNSAAGGLLLMTFALGIVLASFGTALLIGPVGDRKVMVLGSVLAVAAWVAHAAARSYAAGLPLFFLAGLGHGAMLAGATAAAAESEGSSSASDAGAEKRRGRRISLVQAFYMFGLSAGALAGGYAGQVNLLLHGGFFSESGAWAVAFLGSAGVSAAAALLLAASSGPGRGGEPAAEPFRLGVLREVAVVPGVALLALMLFLDICAEAGVGAWLSRHLQETWKATPPLAGWAVALSYAGIAGGRLLLGYWSPRIALTGALLVASAGCAVLAFLLAVVPPPASVAVAALTGLAIAPIVPYGLTIIRNRSPNELAGAATSAALGVACLGSLALPPVMGAVAQWSGSFRTAMLLPAVFFAAITALAAKLNLSRQVAKES